LEVKLGLSDQPEIFSDASVCWIREVNGAIAFYYNVVRAIELFAIIVAGDNFQDSVCSLPNHPARGVLASQKPVLGVECVAICFVGWTTKGFNAFRRAPGTHVVLLHVAEDDTLVNAVPDRPLGKSKVRSQTFNGYIAHDDAVKSIMPDVEKSFIHELQRLTPDCSHDLA
jgi:hypothetical protein